MCSVVRATLGRQKSCAAMHGVCCAVCAAMHARCSSASSVRAAAQPGARSLGAHREVELGAAAASLLALGCLPAKRQKKKIELKLCRLFSSTEMNEM